jgi:hypothetical protein
VSDFDKYAGPAPLTRQSVPTLGTHLGTPFDRR